MIDPYDPGCDCESCENVRAAHATHAHDGKCGCPLADGFVELEGAALTDVIAVWCGQQQEAVGQHYALERRMRDLCGAGGARYADLSAARVTLRTMQDQAAESSLHLRWLLGIEPVCTCGAEHPLGLATLLVERFEDF